MWDLTRKYYPKMCTNCGKLYHCTCRKWSRTQSRKSRSIIEIPFLLFYWPIGGKWSLSTVKCCFKYRYWSNNNIMRKSQWNQKANQLLSPVIPSYGIFDITLLKKSFGECWIRVTQMKIEVLMFHVVLTDKAWALLESTLGENYFKDCGGERC